MLVFKCENPLIDIRVQKLGSHFKILSGCRNTEDFEYLLREENKFVAGFLFLWCLFL